MTTREETNAPPCEETEPQEVTGADLIDGLTQMGGNLLGVPGERTERNMTAALLERGDCALLDGTWHLIREVKRHGGSTVRIVTTEAGTVHRVHGQAGVLVR